MSMADFACVVHFHIGRDASHDSSTIDTHPQQQESQVVTSLLIKILDLSTGSIIPPSFEFELSGQHRMSSIHEAFEEAEQFIEVNFRLPGRRFAVVMDTSILDDIVAECERQDADIPTFFSVAHDAIAAAKSVHYFDSDALEDALTACSLSSWEGPVHEAACFNITRLCKFAVERGYRFPAALLRKATSKKLNKRAASSTQDVASKAHAPDFKITSDSSYLSSADATAPSGSAMLPISQCCRFRGLPYSATKADIVAFCEDIPVDEQNVHIVLGPGGRPSGDAL
jgi:hypothetical protein